MGSLEAGARSSQDIWRGRGAASAESADKHNIAAARTRAGIFRTRIAKHSMSPRGRYVRQQGIASTQSGQAVIIPQQR